MQLGPTEAGADCYRCKFGSFIHGRLSYSLLIGHILCECRLRVHGCRPAHCCCLILCLAPVGGDIDLCPILSSSHGKPVDESQDSDINGPALGLLIYTDPLP